MPNAAGQFAARSVDAPQARDRLSEPAPVGLSDAERQWRDALPGLGIVPREAALIWESPYDSGRRAYATSDRIFKIMLRDRQLTRRFRAQDFAGERAVLDTVRGLAGVPACHDHHTYPAAEVLVLQRVAGRALSDSHSLLSVFTRLASLVRLVVGLSRRGVVHGDLTLENVMVDESGQLWLIDFDQAHMTTPRRALVANFFGGRVDGRRIETSMIGFAKRVIKRALPSGTVAFVRRVRHGAGAFDYRTVPPIAALPADASERLRAMHAAWLAGGESDANSPGAGVCYYSLDIDGFDLPGERAWAPRWADFRGAYNFSGARILELGCNMGLLSSFALAEGGAAAACGVDIDARILEANKLVQRGMGVSYPTLELSFDNPRRWESELAAFKPTLVTALSVLNWITDKPRFVKFLGRFDHVLFEGHDSTEVEAARLRAVGFRSVDLVSVSERGRPVLLARK